MSGNIMKKNIKFQPAKIIINIIKKSNLVIFIIIIAGGLLFVVNTMTNIFLAPASNTTSTQNTPTTTPVNNSATFDQATVDNLNKLKSSSDNSGDQILPSGRINPFSD